MSASCTIVVPCYNESSRLDAAKVEELAQYCRVLLVDDGSTDTTGELITDIASRSNSIEALLLHPNRGKAEAVRLGLLHALDGNAHFVGFTDADFATETANLSRSQILQQAGMAMLTQANQLPQQVLSLLR